MGPIDSVGPISATSLQLTFNPGDDYSPGWAPDGNAILYTYVNEDVSKVPAGSRCIGMLSPIGGTRRFTLCDTRSTQADSLAMFTAAALRNDGELLFFQGTGKPKSSPIPRTLALWLADTAAPLDRRRELRVFPTVIGDSVIETLSDAVWIDDNTFLAIGNRMIYPCLSRVCVQHDTLARPVYLVRGTMEGDSLTLAQIPGTERAARWARLPNGDLVFVRGTVVDGLPSTLVLESTLMRVPANGGTAAVFATVPNGGAIRGLTCQAETCLVLNSTIYRMDPVSAVFTTISVGANEIYSNWDSPSLSPDGSVVVFRKAGDLFRIGVPTP